MTSGNTIRPAEMGDLPAVKRTVEAAYAHYVPRMGKKPGPMLDDYAMRIREGRVHVAESGGVVQGVLVLIPEDDAMLLDNVAVHPKAQGAGLGRKMLEFAEEATISAGYRSIRLYTHVAMTENVALYSRLGWVETHRVEEKGFQRIYMQKQLS